MVGIVLFFLTLKIIRLFIIFKKSIIVLKSNLIWDFLSNKEIIKKMGEKSRRWVVNKRASLNVLFCSETKGQLVLYGVWPGDDLESTWWRGRPIRHLSDCRGPDRPTIWDLLKINSDQGRSLLTWTRRVDHPPGQNRHSKPLRSQVKVIIPKQLHALALR